jgi:hypothetical protein
MFSRINHPPLTKEEEMLIDNQADIGDNIYDIGVVNINRITPKHHVSNTQPQSDKTITHPTIDYGNLDMTVEQSKNDELVAIKTSLKKPNHSKTLSPYV